MSQFPQIQIVDAAGNVVSVFNGAAPGGGVSTEAMQNQIKTVLDNILVDLRAKADLNEIQQIGGSVTATISGGTLTVSNFPAIQTIAGDVAITNFPAVQPISGTVSIAAFPTTQQIAGTVTITNVSNDNWQPYRNLGAATAEVVKVGSGLLFALSCYNAKDVVRFFQLFDSVTVPPTGAEPLESYPIGAESHLVLDSKYFGPKGQEFTNGLVWAFSTSLTAYAPGVSSDQSTHIKYL